MMLGIQPRDAGDAGAVGQFIQRSVTLAQGDHLLLDQRRRKKFTESPHAAEVERGI